MFSRASIAPAAPATAAQTEAAATAVFNRVAADPAVDPSSGRGPNSLSATASDRTPAEERPRAPEGERRVDPETGDSYTREEFVEVFGGTEEWDRLGAAAAEEAAAAPAPRAEQPEPRGVAGQICAVSERAP